MISGPGVPLSHAPVPQSAFMSISIPRSPSHAGPPFFSSGNPFSKGWNGTKKIFTFPRAFPRRFWRLWITPRFASCSLM